MSILRFLVISVAFLSCGGGLSDDQRKALKEEMENREVKKVSDQEIFERSLAMGRELLNAINSNKNQDSLSAANKIQIVFARDTTGLTDIQKLLFEAYNYSEGDLITVNDNIQQDGDDHIMYSAPIIEGDTLTGIWFIRLLKQEVVLSIE